MSERPRHVAALFSALQFRDPRPECLRALNDAEWRALLAFSTRAHLRLILGSRCQEHLPGWVRERIAINLADNTERVARIGRAYQEIAEALRQAGAEHLVMKGFAQFPCFVPELRLRPQSDIDLYCPPGSLLAARDALLKVGYEPDRAPSHDRPDHLPALVRWNGWEWRGNPFDPEMPPAVELHHRFWDASRARFGPADLAAFWSRRIERSAGLLRFPALYAVDSFGCLALHALRDLLYGGLLPCHIYELGYFLHQNAENGSLWAMWLDWHDNELRSMATIPAMLAAAWFDPQLPAAVAEQARRLPGIVPRWYREFSDSPIRSLFYPNKDAVWLHVGLVRSPLDRASVFIRRLFPLWVPKLNSRWVQEEPGSVGEGRQRPIQKYIRYLVWFVTRAIRHLRMLPPVLWRGARLWSS
jgi:hypothetical protein